MITLLEEDPNVGMLTYREGENECVQALFPGESSPCWELRGSERFSTEGLLKVALGSPVIEFCCIQIWLGPNVLIFAA